jgi:hypothetical protein
LLTHLTADSTTIKPPTSHAQASRGGGAYGVGTGFDADDAGEENEEDELYEDIVDEETPESSEQDGQEETKADKRESATFAKDSVDWRVDSLLRKLLLTADLWIEARGLRSGKARDCHGEVSMPSLMAKAKYTNVTCLPFQ